MAPTAGLQHGSGRMRSLNQTIRARDPRLWPDAESAARPRWTTRSRVSCLSVPSPELDIAAALSLSGKS